MIAPYASALAALVSPRRALGQLAALEQLGALGPYGFRDALDYTRPAPGPAASPSSSTYMAHHIGMSLVALTNALAGQLWQRRFHADPLVRSAELLLHERMPRRLVLQEPQTPRAGRGAPRSRSWSGRPCASWTRPDTPAPHVALLGHLPYTVDGEPLRRRATAATSSSRSPAGGPTAPATPPGQFCYLRT